MNIKKFKFNEEATCPSPLCGKSLDDCPAQDFIVFHTNFEGKRVPTGKVTTDRCGWCNVTFTAQATGPDEITIQSR